MPLFGWLHSTGFSLLWQGDLTAPSDGSFILIFDNSFSSFRKKQLYYKLAVPTTAGDAAIEEVDVDA